jgi:dGTPase
VKNTFYNSFDLECREKRNRDYRSPFQQDRDRVIHSFSFRRLQAKTQVFFSGEYDFYRTRLTHSIEVAQIGRSICNYLLQGSELRPDFYIDADLVEAASLSHDLGHPPFGHAGEKFLNQLMIHFGGFEGNAQTLRILTRTIYGRGAQRKGMNPTRAFMDSVLKYKTLFGQMENPQNHFLYDDQKAELDFVFANRPFPEELSPGRALNRFRSIECQIMDWADDTAYSLNDTVDGIKAGFITPARVESWAKERDLTKNQAALLDMFLDIIRNPGIESRFSLKIGDFISACRLVNRKSFIDDLTNRYTFSLVVDEEIQQECDLYKRISKDLIFDSSQLNQLEYKSRIMLRRLFEAFLDNYTGSGRPELSLLPHDQEEALRDEHLPVFSRARLLCDYIAGMTDRFATRMYKRLFDPDFGSIVDLI